ARDAAGAAAVGLEAASRDDGGDCDVGCERREARRCSHKERSGPDGFGREVSGPCRGFGRKGRSGPDSLGAELSGPYRGFHFKGRSGSDTFRPNPGTNPGTNPGAQRAHGEGTPEPQNQERPPPPPRKG